MAVDVLQSAFIHNRGPVDRYQTKGELAVSASRTWAAQDQIDGEDICQSLKYSWFETKVTIRLAS
jgi:hypothetical protein